MTQRESGDMKQNRVFSVVRAQPHPRARRDAPRKAKKVDYVTSDSKKCPFDYVKLRKAALSYDGDIVGDDHDQASDVHVRFLCSVLILDDYAPRSDQDGGRRS